MPGTPFIPSEKLSLTQKEKNAIGYYTGGESLWMNNLLRGIRVHEMINRKHIEAMVDALTNAIRKSPPSTSPTTVYRGASPVDKTWENLKVGDELLFTSKGFVSTSFSKEAAKEFLDGESCCLLILHLPKGTHGLYVGASSLFADLDEDELILPHGSRFIVNTYYIKDGVKVYDATLTHQLGFAKGVKNCAQRRIEHRIKKQMAIIFRSRMDINKFPKDTFQYKDAKMEIQKAKETIEQLTNVWVMFQKRSR